jgi:hypothetical protein
LDVEHEERVSLTIFFVKHGSRLFSAEFAESILGRESEATLHRVSAAACYERSGEPGRTAKLDCAALAGPLTDAGQKALRGS